MKHTIKIFIPLLFIIYSCPVFSQDDLLGEDVALENELKWIQAEAVIITDIATKTEMNADLVPGIVNVLNGKELEKRGIRTVWEAMSLVPGLDAFRYRTIMRGIGYTSSGNIKLLLNGIPVNPHFDGTSFPFYLIPIEQVERIDIIRGPGSALYGKWAYAGVINVITRKQGNRIFGRYSRFDDYAGGLLASYNDPEEDFRISLNLGRWDRDRTGLEAGNDTLYGTENENISNAPGPINDSHEMSGAVINLNYKSVSLLAQSYTHRSGSDFGMLNALPPLDDRKTNIEKNRMAKISLDPEISPELKFKFYLGWNQFIWQLDNLYFLPPGYEEGYTYEDGMKIKSYYEENTVNGGLDIHWKGWENHTLLLGLEYEKTRIGDVWAYTNYNPLDYTPLSSVYYIHGEDNWIAENKTREVISLFCQDLINITDDFILTLGLRWDKYHDTENRLTPRLAGVYQLSNHHILKAQYAEAFRPPSFDEMYVTAYSPMGEGNPELSSEIIRTYELAYIFKYIYFIGKLTAFYTELEELMKWDHVENKVTNTGGAETRGAELELKWNILPSLTADADLSYVDTKDKETDSDLPDIANWLGNFGLLWQPIYNLSFSLQYRYVGERARAVDDPRNKLTDYHTIDFTASIKDLLMKNLTLRTGIKNLCDEDVRAPSRYPGYLEDYPSNGQEWWAQVSYDFE